MKKLLGLQLANGPVPKFSLQSSERPIVYLHHSIIHTKELEKEWLDCTGVRYKCCSFVYLHPDMIYWTPRAWETYLLNVGRGTHIMMDSGAYSFHVFLFRHQEIPNVDALRQKTIDAYIEFCQKREKKWDFYVTFDYVRDVELVWKITKQLEKEGLKPVPVYHGDKTLNWMRKYLDAGYRRIGISSLLGVRSSHRNLRFFLDNLFKLVEPYKDVKLHGFGMTSLSTMFAYPWDSVDSSSYSRTSSHGCIYIVDAGKNTMATCHVSQRPSPSNPNSYSQLAEEARTAIREQVEKRGFDFDLLTRSITYRHIYNGWLFSHLNQFRKQIKDTHVRYQHLL
jgi:hypothetical protein